jgi:hypothetical protein
VRATIGPHRIGTRSAASAIEPTKFAKRSWVLLVNWLSAGMSIFQRIRTLVAEPKRLGNRLFLDIVTVPLEGLSHTVPGFVFDRALSVRVELKSAFRSTGSTRRSEPG